MKYSSSKFTIMTCLLFLLFLCPIKAEDGKDEYTAISRHHYTPSVVSYLLEGKKAPRVPTISIEPTDVESCDKFSRKSSLTKKDLDSLSVGNKRANANLGVTDVFSIVKEGWSLGSFLMKALTFLIAL